MTEKQFMDFFNEYLNLEILPTMIGKGLGQYSSENDRFENFKGLSGLLLESKEKSLTNLVAKQIICLYTQMRNWDQVDFIPTPHFYSMIGEVIKDIIIYMFLLRGMMWEYEKLPNDPRTKSDSTTYHSCLDRIGDLK